MSEVRIPALAKVNLRLEVLGKRPDGFHELRTIFQSISLRDELRLRSTRKSGIELRVRGNVSLSNEPVEGNLVYRAVDALRQELRQRDGIAIELCKAIPAGRGLGGGSSDAASALIGYLRLAKKQLPRERLFELAATLGADVPFFLEGGRALGIGKGDEIYPLPDIPKLHLLVVSPNAIHVPTPDAYRWLDAAKLNAAQLTNSAGNPKLYRFCALSWSLQGSPLLNDFEDAVFQQHPRLAELKRDLLQNGATEALLAGSGSAVIGVFPSPAKARRAAVGFPLDQTFVCETVSRDSYRRLIQSRTVLGAPRD
ncbi:MAG: 4-(cytidine 5'-diphospho)-2-C-methyl-D-erythritol kinase [Acidobacteria bacterium]|nr:MAG: 4-(cytidine 5'-diphospho)-2-C-methyl-D-erythritol kinase [Acidobacteriota bacterium]